MHVMAEFEIAKLTCHLLPPSGRDCELGLARDHVLWRNDRRLMAPKMAVGMANTVLGVSDKVI